MLAQPTPSPSTTSYEVVRETWLTRKPREGAGFIAALFTLALGLGSLIYLLDIFNASAWMPVSRDSIFVRGEYWRLLTAIFAHGDTGHLISNSVLFFILAYFLHGYFGWRLFPLGAFVGGALSYLAVLPSQNASTVIVGASGVVYWMGGTWLVLYFFLSRQKNLLQRWLRSFGVALLLFMPAEKFEPHISYQTHFVGFSIGLAFGLYHYWRFREKFAAAEVRELISEEIDPGDELPPPESFR